MITDVANNDIFLKSRIKFICLIECVNLIEILLTYSNYEKVTRVLRGSTANLQNKSEKRQLTYRGTIRGGEYIRYIHWTVRFFGGSPNVHTVILVNNHLGFITKYDRLPVLFNCPLSFI